VPTFPAGAALIVAVVLGASVGCSRAREPSNELRQRTSFWLVPHQLDIAPTPAAAASTVKLRDLGAFKRVIDQVIVRARVVNDSDRPQLPLVTFTFNDGTGRALGDGACSIERSVLRPHESAPCWVSARKGAVSARFDIYLSPQPGVESALARRHDLDVTRAEIDRVRTPPGPGVPSQFFFSGTIARARVPKSALPRVDVDFYAGDVWVGHVATTFSVDALATKGATFSGSTDEINLLKAPTRVQATAFVQSYEAAPQ